jgi:hypothetical protein
MKKENFCVPIDKYSYDLPHQEAHSLAFPCPPEKQTN